MPVVLALLVYGRELIQLWVGADFCRPQRAAAADYDPRDRVRPGRAVQFRAILFGLGEHGAYARGVLIEAVLNITLMLVVIPRYGILGRLGLRLLDAGQIADSIRPGWCAGARLRISEFLRSIYLRPVLIALPVVALASLAQVYGLGGSSWLEVIAAREASPCCNSILAFFFCIERSHRGLFRLQDPLPAPRAARGPRPILMMATPTSPKRRPSVLSVFGVITQRIGGIESYARELSAQLARHGWDSILWF